MEEVPASSERFFQSYGRPPTLVFCFKYLVLVLTALDYDWPVVVGKIRKSQKKRARIPWILGRGGGDVQVLGTFFNAVVQVVLLFGSKTWMMTPCMVRALRLFLHTVARSPTGKQPRRIHGVSW